MMRRVGEDGGMVILISNSKLVVRHVSVCSYKQYIIIIIIIERIILYGTKIPY